jgi:hypothetical protein
MRHSFNPANASLERSSKLEVKRLSQALCVTEVQALFAEPVQSGAGNRPERLLHEASPVLHQTLSTCPSYQSGLTIGRSQFSIKQGRHDPGISRGADGDIVTQNRSMDLVCADPEIPRCCKCCRCERATCRRGSHSGADVERKGAALKTLGLLYLLLFDLDF